MPNGRIVINPPHRPSSRRSSPRARTNPVTEPGSSTAAPGGAGLGLRARLNLLLALVFVIALAAAVAYLLAFSREAVQDELAASTRLASTLLAGMLYEPDAGHAELPALIERLADQAGLRHLELRWVPVGAAAEAVLTSDQAGAAPAWFVRLVRPEPTLLSQQLTFAAGTLSLVADPADEIAEAWRETRATLATLLAVAAGALAVAFVFLGRALAPLAAVSRALQDVEHGDYAARLPASGLPDIDGIVERFNHMVAALSRSRADNARLARRSLDIQEEERRHLAHELHDEMGQSITAIKALAASIEERARGAESALAERAGTIVDVSSDIYARVRRMMARLQPVALDELGLVAALELMIDDWNVHHAECFCSYHAPRDVPALAPALRISLYRIVQEALTNIAKHAGAATVAVELARDMGALVLEVRDDGRGFDPAAQRRGLGLLGMAERAAAMDAELAVVTAPGAGVTIRVHVPAARIIEENRADGRADTHPAG